MPLNVKEIMDAFTNISDTRNLSRDIVEDALAEAMEKAYKKNIGNNDVEVETTFDDGFFHLYHLFHVVENEDEIENKDNQILSSEALEIDPDAKAGEIVKKEIDIQKFDRAAVILAKSVIKQKIREAEKIQVYNE